MHVNLAQKYVYLKVTSYFYCAIVERRWTNLWLGVSAKSIGLLWAKKADVEGAAGVLVLKHGNSTAVFGDVREADGCPVLGRHIGSGIPLTRLEPVVLGAI